MRMLHMAATLGPVGYAPVAQGTAASLIAGVIWLALAPVPRWMLGLLIPLAALGVAAAGAVARDRRTADPPEVVIDEAIGMLLALALGPAGLTAALLTFGAFRVFDIVKPFPVRHLERLPGGWGIVADDVAAALYAAAAVRLIWIVLS
jgi:phosphatidylglycerophosphatase A